MQELSTRPDEYANPQYESGEWDHNSRILCHECKRIMWIAPNFGGSNMWKYKCGDCGQEFTTNYR